MIVRIGTRDVEVTEEQIEAVDFSRYGPQETLTEIAYAAGMINYHPHSDSRDTIEQLVRWAHEFEAAYYIINRGEQSDTYIEDVQEFANRKMNEDKPTTAPVSVPGVLI